MVGVWRPLAHQNGRCLRTERQRLGCGREHGKSLAQFRPSSHTSRLTPTVVSEFLKRKPCASQGMGVSLDKAKGATMVSFFFAKKPYPVAFLQLEAAIEILARRHTRKLGRSNQSAVCAGRTVSPTSSQRKGLRTLGPYLENLIIGHLLPENNFAVVA